VNEDRLKKNFGLTKTDDGYTLDAKSLLASVGGIQGIIETSLPGFLYVLTFSITRNIYWSVSVVVVAVIVLGIRHLLKKRPISQLIGSYIGIALAIFLTLRPGGQAADFYLKDFYINGAYGSVLLVSVIARFPLIGFLVETFMGSPVNWRKDRRKLRFYDLVTLLWVGLFATRLAVEVPLYLVGDVVTLEFCQDSARITLLFEHDLGVLAFASKSDYPRTRW